MRRRYILIGFAVIALLSMALPAAGAPSALSVARKALKLATTADRTAKNDYYARIGPAAEVISGKGVQSAARASVGDFNVTFGRSVQACTPVAAVRGTAENQFHGFITTYQPAANVIRVVVRDPAGQFADGAGFNLAVIC